MPVLKPNEATIEEAAATGAAIGLLAGFGPTLDTVPPEFPAELRAVPKLAAGALAALDRGDGEEHDRMAAEAARGLAASGRCAAVALAQSGLARAAPAVAAATGLPVLTTPDSAMRKLRRVPGA